MTGRSVTDLRPAGIAEIDSQRLDVVTDGEYIDVDTPIVVIGVKGNRIIVEKTLI
jgi:membrane-bound serine protease (ClpP class)